MINESNTLDLTLTQYKLPKDFKGVYLEKYKHSILLIQEIIKQKTNGLDDEFFVSYLALNELFSAIRDEMRSIILFKTGHTISRWCKERSSANIPEKLAKNIYKNTMSSTDLLFKNKLIEPLSDEPEEDAKNFSQIHSSILFKINRTETQDAILLTTAILNKADYFVTNDEKLIKAARELILDHYSLRLIKATEAYNILKRHKKQGK